VALFDNILELFQSGGGALGAGGALVAGEVYRRFQGAKKDAKEALKIAREAKAIAEREVTAARAAGLTAYERGLEDALRKAREYVDEKLQKIARGSVVELQSESERLTRLETRVSAIEDDADARDLEEKRWQGEIQRSLGRIEGQLEVQSRG
jgi:oligoendopeptidase F